MKRHMPFPADEPGVRARERIGLPPAALQDFCRRWRIAELAVFGSVLRDDFGPHSDLDVLVRWAPDAAWSILDHVRMEEELAQLVGRRVELVSRDAVEASPNWIIRRGLLGSARQLYVA